jgi:hypothetical protein
MRVSEEPCGDVWRQPEARPGPAVGPGSIVMGLGPGPVQLCLTTRIMKDLYRSRRPASPGPRRPMMHPSHRDCIRANYFNKIQNFELKQN